MGKVFLLADIGPIRDGATANYSVSWSLCSAIDREIGVLMTRRGNRWIDPARFGVGLQSRVELYRDAWHLGLRRFSEDFRSLLDQLMFLTEAGRMGRRLREEGCDRIFIIGSNHWGCLVPGLILSKLNGIPVEVFLMDDLEASAVMQGNRVQARVARWMERWLLKKFRRVWAISSGYAEHLVTKYGPGVSTELLPLPIRSDRVTYRPHEEEVQYVGYSGSTHGLYEGPLKELVQILTERNQEAGKKVCGLRIYLSGEVPGLRARLGDQEGVIETVIGATNEELVKGLSMSYANFLPYSFEEEYRLMVSTAFSCKTSEFLLCGRPILIYGPEYASVPRHFKEAGIPLVETNEGCLQNLFEMIPAHDGCDLIKQYEELLRGYHSPEAIRNRLRNSWDW